MMGGSRVQANVYQKTHPVGRIYSKRIFSATGRRVQTCEQTPSDDDAAMEKKRPRSSQKQPFSYYSTAAVCSCVYPS